MAAERLDDLGPSPDGLRDLLHRYQAEEVGLRSALEAAETELDRRVRVAWLCCVRGELAPPSVRALCELARDEVENLERDLAHARAAVVGVSEELDRVLTRAQSIRTMSLN